MQSYNFNRAKTKKINLAFLSNRVNFRKKTSPLPSSYSRTPGSNNQKYFIRVIIRSFVYYIAIIITSFFVFMGIFSNIDSLWGFFRPKETYEEKQFGPAKPYLSTENEFTKESTVNFSGTSESGKKVVLYRGGEYAEETIADSGNKFEFISVNITAENDAVTKFYVEVEDGQGNKSPQSNTVLINYDNKKPSLSVSDPKADQRVKDYSRSYVVVGKTDKDAKIYVGNTLGRVSPEGDFTVNIALKDEVNVLKVKAVDKAGNESFVEVPVYFEKRD